MSKTKSKNGRRNGHNGHNGNGRSRPAKKPPPKKPATRKPQAKKSSNSGVGGSAMIVRRNDNQLQVRSALESEPESRRPIGERIDSMGASHVAAAATAAAISTALASGAVSKGMIGPKNVRVQGVPKTCMISEVVVKQAGEPTATLHA